MKSTVWRVIKENHRRTAFKGEGARFMGVGGIQWGRR